MKKILSTALMFVLLSTAVVDTINAARTTDSATMTAVRARRGVQKRRPAARGRGRGVRRLRANSQQVQAVLDTARKTDNPVVKAEAMKTANELAKELLADLQDRTWAGDVLGKYTPEQVAAAGAKYTNLEIQRTALMRDIDAKQAELDGMSAKSMIFWTKAEGGKEEAHKIASQQLAEMKNTLRDVNKAMRNQAVIAGKEYCSAIRMAVGALTAVGIAGGIYGIDKYQYKGAGMEYLGETYKAGRKAVAMKEGETYRQYLERGTGSVYTSIKDTFNDIYDGTGTKLNALKTAITDKIESVWGSKKDAPKQVSTAATTAENTQKTADQLQVKADESGKPVDQAKADTAQVKADGDLAKLDTIVDAEAARTE